MKKSVIFAISAMSVVLGILLVGNILLIGEKIGLATHIYVEYFFYFLIAGLLFYFVVIPLARLLLMPEFPKLRTEDGWDVKKMKRYAGSLAGNCFYISDLALRKKREDELRASLKNAGDDVQAIKTVIDAEINDRVSNINTIISRSGRKVFLLTAASQNATLDTLSVIILNIKLIYNIVCATGYRPNIFQLGRIMIAVLSSAFTAYISQSLTSSLEGGLKNLFANTGFPIIGPILGMFLNGSLNAALTLYVGYTTRNYVLKGPSALNDETDRSGVISSAVSLVSDFIKESFSSKKEAAAGALTEKVTGIGKSLLDRLTDWFKTKEAPSETL